MPGPRVLNFQRPYATVEEFLEREGWTIERRTLLLLDAPPLIPDEVIRFTVSLASGERVLRAEGQVLGPTDPEDSLPSSVRIRFKRFDRATKDLIELLLSEREAEGEAPTPMSIVADIPPSIDRGFTAIDSGSAPRARAARSVPPSRRSSPPSEREPEPPKKSAPRAITTPADRDELLERLRQRAQRKAL